MIDNKKKSVSKVAKKNSMNEAEEVSEKPVRRMGRWIKWLLVLMLLLLLIAIGFAAGIYLKIFDIQTLAERSGLTENPVVKKYIVQPKTNFETVPLDAEPQLPVTLPLTELPPADPTQATENKAGVQKIDVAELQRLEKMKKEDEAKRIGKTARLYGNMKPEEAIPILNQLDDVTVLAIFSKMEEDQVAKLLAAMEAKRAAALTQSMLKSKIATGAPQPGAVQE